MVTLESSFDTRTWSDAGVVTLDANGAGRASASPRRHGWWRARAILPDGSIAVSAPAMVRVNPTATLTSSVPSGRTVTRTTRIVLTETIRPAGADDRLEVYPRGLQSKVRGLQVHGRAVTEAEAGQRTAVNLHAIERSAIERGDVLAPPGCLVPTVLVDATIELVEDAPRPVKTRDRVRFHAGTQEVMARTLLVGTPELAPGGRGHARFRLETPIVALPGDRYVIRSYSPIVTIGGGTLLDVAPPRFRRRAPALLAHLTLLETGTAAEVLEEHLVQAGAAGARLHDLRARTPFGPERLRAVLEELQQGGRVMAVDREWYLHRTASDRLRTETLALLEAFHRDNPLRGGISREELRSRAGHAQERVFAQLLATLEHEGLVRRDARRDAAGNEG